VTEYLEIRGTIPESGEATLAELLSSLPILGVQVLPPDSGSVTVEVWLRGNDVRVADQVESVLAHLGSVVLQRRSRREEDWAAGWRASLAPFAVGRRWWIDPHPDRETAAPAGRIRLALEPRSAFGSGTHESTQLVLRQLERCECRDRTVLDIGTGSGVLAVAADALGAASVVAVDTDVTAAWEANATAARQSWPCRPMIVAGTIDCLGDASFDLVLCNMVVSEFGPLIRDIRRLLSAAGTAVFSGILGSERETVSVMLDDGGLTVTGEVEAGEWLSLSTGRAGAS
jgi:ribosomal protein L11 methyltransferase